MNFTHLAVFNAVAETGSVTAAAERLHVSQPALTREIRESWRSASVYQCSTGCGVACS